jgi:hypothetical protein
MVAAPRRTVLLPLAARALLVAAALALAALALFLAAPTRAGAKPSHKPTAKPNAAQARQIAKLEALTAALATELAGLEARSSALAAKAATPATVPPTVLPFQGLAGGSLTGAYPDPRLAPGTVGITALTGGSVTSAAIRDGSLTGADVEDGSLVPPLIPAHQVFRSIIPPGAGDAPNFGTVFEYPGPGNTEGQRTIFPGEFSVVIKLSCPAGTTLLTGGWEWSDENGDGTTMFESHPAENSLETGTSFANTTWEWRPKVRPNVGTENTFKPKLLCLLD